MRKIGEATAHIDRGRDIHWWAYGESVALAVDDEMSHPTPTQDGQIVPILEAVDRTIDVDVSGMPPAIIVWRSEANRDA